MQSSESVFFSIIIPLYNCEDTLAESLESIISQSYANYEIIFADGASTDNTLQIIKNFKTENNNIHIKLLSEPDKGIYDAMNKGISLAQGNWLYFMGSDDRLCSSSVLSVVSSEIEREYADLVYGNVIGISSKIRYVYDTLGKVLAKGIHHQSVFYRTSLFLELGKYDLKFKIASDYHFTLKVFFKDQYIKRYIDKDIAYYGEKGYSSQYFDYKLFSGHYRLLAAADAISKIEDPQKCLTDSIYCCLVLASERRNFYTAWSNALYYIINVKGLHLSYRIKTVLRMLMWTITPSRQTGL